MLPGDRETPSYPHEQALRAGLDAARPEAVARQHARGRRTARERIALLVDADSFREIGALARPEAPGRDGSPMYADAIVTGVAAVDGRPVVVVSSDFTVAGGSNGELGNEKMRRAWEIAGARGMAVVMLFDGGGHRLQEGFDARVFAGGFPFQQALARLSGWVPLLAAILGPGYGQPTLTAALCDFVVAVRGQAEIGMAPASLVRAATGEEIDPATVYGADAQASFGAVDQVVDDEEDALLALRDCLALLPDNAEAPLPDGLAVGPEAEAAAELDHVVPTDQRRAYDMHRVVAGLVDEDSQVELKGHHAQNMITMLASVDGMPLGIIANQPAVQAGVLDPAGARKAARLVSLCDAFALPVLVLIDLPGLAVGSAAELAGAGNAAAALSLELASASVATFTVHVRKGYGGGFVVQSGGRTHHPELVLAWPTAQTAVMSAVSAVGLVHRREIAGAPDPEAARRELVARYSSTAGALRAAEGFGVDAVVRPSETRAHLVATMRELPRRRLTHHDTPRRHAVRPL